MKPKESFSQHVINEQAKLPTEEKTCVWTSQTMKEACKKEFDCEKCFKLKSPSL